jgi:Copper type II ascorbate-dependent monooxygenase, N-terminal domain/Copper type II ascorbate-dependent monooxygenase, C-terminal domain/DOMON domain
MCVLQCQLLICLCSAILAISSDSSPFGGRNDDVYREWLRNVTFTRHTWLESFTNSDIGVAVHWNIHDEYIHLGIACKATGWVGFGIAEAGSMKGADIFMYVADSNELIDSHVLGELVMPLVDDCQDWNLIFSQKKNGFLIVEATRLLDTGDDQDRAIKNDGDDFIPATRIIAAWGDTSTPSYHDIHNRVKGAIRFLGKTSVKINTFFQKKMESEAEGYFMVQAVNYTIPSQGTTYARFCITPKDLIAQGVPIDEELHIIGIEPIIDARTSEHVHHFTLYGDERELSGDQNCNLLYNLIFGWAPGDIPIPLPPNAGIPLGKSGMISFSLQIHYDNPDFVTGLLDNSGTKIYYTTKKRQYDIGIIQIGDPFISLYGTQVGSPAFISRHTFDCRDDCSLVFLNQSITVISEHLHMHKSGVRMKNSQFRENKEIRAGEVEYFDFDQQGGFGVIQDPFTVQPGDSFRVSCEYHAKEGEIFGIGSSQEMCIAFLSYYPRMTITREFGNIPFVCGRNLLMISECDAGWNFSKIMNVSDMGRVFGTSPASCPILKSPSSEPPEPEVKSKPSSFGITSSMMRPMIYLAATNLAVLVLF